MKLILDYDPMSGISHWVDTDEETGLTTYGVDQETAAIVDRNKAEYNADHGRWGDGQKVASIPMALYAEWMREGKDKDQAFLKGWLNDPDNRAFRTRPGRI